MGLEEHDIAADLVTFLDMADFVIVNVMVFDRDGADTDGPIGYDPVVKIKGQSVDIGGRWFPDFDEARLHALDYVLDIFEEEQKILARAPTIPANSSTWSCGISTSAAERSTSMPT